MSPSLSQLTPSSGPEARHLGDVALPATDSSELIRHRFLSFGGGMLLCAATGLGKSVLAMQMKISWALGRPCFGIEPTRPLKSLLVQAENDDGDLAEFRDGIFNGLELTAADRALVSENVLVHSEVKFVGTMFSQYVLEPLLVKHKPDIVWIDPVLAYLGGDANSQEKVGGFLRNSLNPLLHKHRCAAVIIHHSAKPPREQGNRAWQSSDYAYAGSGSIEWANWARAVLVIRPMGGQEGCFELLAGKRGSRLRWRNANGAATNVRAIAHSTEDGALFWKEATVGAQAEKSHSTYDPARVLALLPPEGLRATEWQRVATENLDCSEKTFYRIRKELEGDRRIVKAVDRWKPTQIP